MQTVTNANCQLIEQNAQINKDLGGPQPTSSKPFGIGFGSLLGVERTSVIGRMQQKQMSSC